LRLQETLYYIQRWLKKWRVKANKIKSVQMTFIIRRYSAQVWITKTKVIARFTTISSRLEVSKENFSHLIQAQIG
jgi:hypothetical protein